MGVSHLKQYTDSANKASGHTGYAGSTNLTGGAVPKAGKAMPGHSGVDGYSREALRANAAPKQHAKSGVRAGAKSGQPKTGTSQAGILGKAMVLPNGGRKG